MDFSKPRSRNYLLVLFLSIGSPLGLCGASGAPGGLREMTTDRPDATESPFTVDAGHLQLEMHGVGYTRDEADGVKSTLREIAPFNLRLGLTSILEAGVFFSPYVRSEEQTAGGTAIVHRGVGDTVVRLKTNVWGNDGGETALGVFFDVKLPTAAEGLGNDEVEGAIIMPFAYELGRNWAGGMMTAVEIRYTDAARYRPVWINTMTFGCDLTTKTGGFLELTSELGDGPHVATFNMGLTYRLNPDTQFDAGINFGISKTAPDRGFFAGLSKRY